MVVEKNGGLTVDVSVKPGGSRDKVEWDGTVLTVRTRAKPVEGQANAAVVALLADALDLPKSRVTLEKGEKSRQKRVALAGVDTAGFLLKMKTFIK
jgi:uncharacterized protein (TIGR00251 family)